MRTAIPSRSSSFQRKKIHEQATLRVLNTGAMRPASQRRSYLQRRSTVMIFWEVCGAIFGLMIIGAWYMETYLDTTFSSNSRIITGSS